MHCLVVVHTPSAPVAKFERADLLLVLLAVVVVVAVVVVLLLVVVAFFAGTHVCHTPLPAAAMQFDSYNKEKKKSLQEFRHMRIIWHNSSYVA